MHCDDGVTEDERLEIDRWIDMHDTDGIDTVVVGALVVAVHSISNTFAIVGTAVRHGDVVAELGEALEVMRRSRGI